MNIKFYIWSNQHEAWWKPAKRGYTEKIEKAGVYSLEEAIEICNGANWNIGAEAKGFLVPDEAMVPIKDTGPADLDG